MSSPHFPTSVNPRPTAPLLQTHDDPLLAAAARREEVERRLSALSRFKKAHSMNQSGHMDHPESPEQQPQFTKGGQVEGPETFSSRAQTKPHSIDEENNQQPTAWETATAAAQGVAAQTVETVKALASTAVGALSGNSTTAPATTSQNRSTHEQEKRKEAHLEAFGSLVQAQDGMGSRDTSNTASYHQQEAAMPTKHPASGEERVAPYSHPGIAHVPLHRTPFAHRPVMTIAALAEHAMSSTQQQQQQVHSPSHGPKPATTVERLGTDTGTSGGRKEVSVEPLTPREIAEKEWAQRLPPRVHRSTRSPRSAWSAAGAAGMDEDWLWKLIEYLWPKIRQVTQEMAWEMVPPILNESKPSWVHGLNLAKFELGTREPDLRNVRCYVDEDDVMDDIFIEMDLEWRSQQDVEIELQILGKDVSSMIPNFLEEQLAKLFTMVVGIEDSIVKGTVQLALRPLMYRLPIVGAVQVGFTEMPEFDFEPTVAGGPMGSALNALLPSVKAWLKTTVNEAIWSPYVLPEHYFYPLDPGAPDLQRSLGVLHVRIIEATHIPCMDLFGVSDSFVEAYVRHTQRNTTKVISGKNPQWDQVFIMPVHSPTHQHLKFALWDYDAISPNDEIGRCELAISDLPEESSQDLWLDVINEGEEEQKAAKTGEDGIQYRKRDRAVRALAKPVTGHSVRKTALHVRVHWRRWTDEETQFIKYAAKTGMRKALASSRGRSLDPDLKKMLMSGTVNVTMQQCTGIDVHGLLRKPQLKMVVTVGDMDPQETPPFKVSRRGNADMSGAPVQVNVPGEVANQEKTQVVIQLQEVGFMSGGDIVGTLKIPLHELMDKRCISGQRQLEEGEGNGDGGGNGGGGHAKFEIRWVGNFD